MSSSAPRWSPPCCAVTSSPTCRCSRAYEVALHRRKIKIAARRPDTVPAAMPERFRSRCWATISNMMIRRLFRPLLILLALIFLFEAWLWSRLAPIVAWVVARIPWAAFKAKLAGAIRRLPPYPTFLVFLVPVLLLLPLKVLALWMLAHGSWLGAVGVLAFAKMVSVGVTAFIFELTRPKLLELDWFRWLYEHV